MAFLKYGRIHYQEISLFIYLK